MAFWGTSFIFNDVPCEDYDLMVYDIGDGKESSSTFASSPTIIEEVVGKRWRPYFYGVNFGQKLEHKITFGVNTERIDNNKWLDRYEIEEISSWLTGHDNYMWLAIQQEDMSYVRFRCIVTSLTLVTYAQIPWTFEATFVCDSAYGYLYPQTYSYNVNGEIEIDFYNESSLNGYYRPIMRFEGCHGENISVENITDGGRKFELSGYPAAASTIVVDNDKYVITTDNTDDLNIYPYCNYKFLRLKRGYNKLKITGNCTFKLVCEFPVNVGG